MEPENPTTDPGPDWETLKRHLRRMQTATVSTAAVVVALAASGFAMPRLTHAVLTPPIASILAAVAALWIGFSANRDARLRMDRIKRAFAVHGNFARLLRDHFLAYLAVLCRLGAMAAGGLIVSIWGLGPEFGLLLDGLALAMVALSWPTEAKSRLLIRRAASLR